MLRAQKCTRMRCAQVKIANRKCVERRKYSTFNPLLLFHLLSFARVAIFDGHHLPMIRHFYFSSLLFTSKFISISYLEFAASRKTPLRTALMTWIEEDARANGANFATMR